MTCGVEAENDPHQQVNFLGLMYNTPRGRSPLESVEVTDAAHSQLEEDPSSLTLRHVARLFGVCSFASRALRCQTAEYFSTFEYIRRKAARIVTSLSPLWELPANIWKAITP